MTKKIRTSPRHRTRATHARRGTISYRVSQKSRVQIRIEQKGHPNRHVILRRTSGKGRSTVHFSTKIGGHRLTPGGYRVSVSALANGKQSQEKRAGFRILKS